MKQIEQTKPETNQGANPSHAVLVAEIVRLRELNRALLDSCKALLRAMDIDDPVTYVTTRSSALAAIAQAEAGA